MQKRDLATYKSVRAKIFVGNGISLPVHTIIAYIDRCVEAYGQSFDIDRALDDLEKVSKLFRDSITQERRDFADFLAEDMA